MLMGWGCQGVGQPEILEWTETTHCVKCTNNCCKGV